MSAKKCPSCGKERCPGIVMRLDCPAYIRDNPPSQHKVVTLPVVTASDKVVTEKPNVVTYPRGQGWRLIGDKPMTPAERQQRHREKV